MNSLNHFLPQDWQSMNLDDLLDDLQDTLIDAEQ